MRAADTRTEVAVSRLSRVDKPQSLLPHRKDRTHVTLLGLEPEELSGALFKASARSSMLQLPCLRVEDAISSCHNRSQTTVCVRTSLAVTQTALQRVGEVLGNLRTWSRLLSRM